MKLQKHLKNGTIDIVMSGILLNTKTIESYDVSVPYMEQTVAFIVPDYLRNKFNSLDELMNNKDLSVAVTENYYKDKLKALLPQAKGTTIPSPRQFFKSGYKNSEALLYMAEAGSAWTLIYPSFSVAIPYPKIIKIPMVYPLPIDDPKWKQFVDTWILLNKNNGTINTVFNHWIKGEGANIKEKRWSIIKDVFHWTD